MNDRINELLKKEPGLGVARRSSLLVAASGPYPGVQRTLNKIPGANLVMAGAISSFYIALTAVPQLAIEQAADRSLGGRPITPEQVAARRRLMLAGNAATIAAAVVAQRAIIRSSHAGSPFMQAGRVLTSQVAIGAAAGAIVTGSDAVLGPLARRKDKKSAATIALGAGIMAVNRRLLRKSASVLTLPTRPTPYSYVG